MDGWIWTMVGFEAGRDSVPLDWDPLYALAPSVSGSGDGEGDVVFDVMNVLGVLLEHETAEEFEVEIMKGDPDDKHDSVTFAVIGVEGSLLADIS